MPRVNGKYVDLATWYEHNAQRPVFGSAGAAEREEARLRAERHDGDDVDGIVARVIGDSEARPAAAKAAVAAAMGLTLDDPALDDVTIEDSGRQYDRNDPFGESTGGAFLALPVAHEPVEVRTPVEPIPAPEIRAVAPRKPQSGSPEPSEGAAGRFSRRHGLPKHRKRRPSQLPSARHARYVRAVALKNGVTDAVADRDLVTKHPSDCPFRSPQP